MLQPSESWKSPASYSSKIVIPSDSSPTMGASFASAGIDKKEIVLRVQDIDIRFEAIAQNVNRFKAIFTEFERLATLQENWDSYGARGLRMEAFLAALSFLASIISKGAPCPHISLTNTGGVHLEWTHEGRGIEVDIENSADQEAYLIDEETGAVEELENLSPDDVAGLLGR